MSKRTETTRPSGTEVREDDAFLSRWARRKRVARSGGDPDADDTGPADVIDHGAPADASPSVDDSASEARADESPELSDADMPPVESIDENTDMSGFFSPRVSQALRQAALRKFFHSQAFNFVDGLDDYDDDFRTFEALGDIITSDMRGRMELEARRAKESLAERAEQAEDAHTAEIESGAAPDAQPAPGEQGDAEAQGVARDADRAGAGAAQGVPAPDYGITRDPARLARPGPAKLRPRSPRDDAAGEDASDDPIGEGEDA